MPPPAAFGDAVAFAVDVAAAVYPVFIQQKAIWPASEWALARPFFDSLCWLSVGWTSCSF